MTPDKARDLVRRIALETAATLQNEPRPLNGWGWQEIADELQRASDIAQELANNSPMEEDE